MADSSIEFIKFSKYVHELLGPRKLRELDQSVRRTWANLPQPPEAARASGATFACWIGCVGDYTNAPDDDEIFVVRGERAKGKREWQLHVRKGAWQRGELTPELGSVMMDANQEVVPPEELEGKTVSVIDALDREDNHMFKRGDKNDIEGWA